VRYLIASLTVGTLFAYLSYRSLTRRLIFIGAAFIVPVLANWMRAYMIVMLGHLSGNKLAAGVDHLIYGWLFFGVVIMAMLWIGSRWREDEFPSPAALSTAVSAEGHVATFPPLVSALMVIALASMWLLAQWQIERTAPPEVSQLARLGPITGWHEFPDQFTDWSPRFENPSAAVQTTFGNDGRMVGLFLAYYRNQDYSRKMVSSSNVLVNTGNPLWAQVAGGTRQIAIGQQSISVRTAELRSTDSTRILAWRWYWVNGHLTASDYKAKAYTALSLLTGQGDDSAVIIVYAPKEQAGGGEAALEAFADAAAPEIYSVLTRTRERR
jgi:EpsI family protein